MGFRKAKEIFLEVTKPIFTGSSHGGPVKAGIDWAPGPGLEAAGCGDEKYDDVIVDDSEFPTMEEAVMMSRGIKTDVVGSGQQTGRCSVNYKNVFCCYFSAY